VRAARDAAAAHRVIAGTMHPAIAAGFSAEALEAVRVRLLAEPEPPQRPSLKRRDWLGAGSVFLWVFLITFPVVVPFFFFHTEPARALLWSNAVALVLLFFCGWFFGRHSGGGKWGAGFAMVLLGAVLVAIVMALGG
jgi:VIT1/CCC1 family predicted Fe2+/Mn2+ transporter